MKSKIMIAYASKHGSTKEMAEKISEVLHDNGFAVDLKSVENINTISEYHAVILGSSLYIGRLDKRVLRFVKNKKEILKDMKTWFFTSGPTGPDEPSKDLSEKHMSVAVKETLVFIDPEEITCFSGSIDINKLNMFERWIVNNVKASTGDYRNWKSIESWAKKISDELL